MMKTAVSYLMIGLMALVILTVSCRASNSPEDQKTIDELKKTYPLTTCPVSGEKLSGDMGTPIDYLYKTTINGKESVRLVRFCCSSCVKSFNKDPNKYLKTIDDAAKTGK